MGVPSFYRWLSEKYSKIVVNAVEKKSTTDHQEYYYYDGKQPNPNGIEFDNLYLDMNGIIHPCFHPENDVDGNGPVTKKQVFESIEEYIDRLMSIVRPKKLLYMAIDGVAPRAKMNQQRTRRFRNAKDQQNLKLEEKRLRKQFEMEGRDLLPEHESEVSDSNVITPGTEFMYELAKHLEGYISLRISNHPGWKHLKVILSDANSPGEGEHKIMSFIRLQRACEGYDPNTSHVLYGLDADLIMLALATHEIHFSILRENVRMDSITARSNTSFLAETSEAKVFDLEQGLEETAEQLNSLAISTVSKKKSPLKKPYQFLHVWILREYLNLDLKPTNLPEKFVCDLERLIDDFIFICFFAGNDFLPHMPSLEIHEGALDLLLHVYKEEFKNLGGYLVDAQRVNEKKGVYMKLKRVEKFILAIGAYEDKIFTKRSAVRGNKLRRILSECEKTGGNGEEDLFSETHTFNQKSFSVSAQTQRNTKMMKDKMKSFTLETSDVWRNGLITDRIKLGTPGWRNRYYKCKFLAETEDEIEKTRKKVVEEYTRGLCWVFLYYFSGVPSWTWFYPYHYGPFASDLKGLSSTKVIFDKGVPFKPFDQLMAVLPPTSAHALPRSYQSLMTDKDSSILDFYPSDFESDTDGKRFLWQSICKLPFINEERLLTATKNVEKELSEEEAKRNVINRDKLFVHVLEDFASRIMGALDKSGSSNSIKIENGDMCGFVSPKLESANDLNVLCVNYDPPSFQVHIPRVLEGTTIPEMVVGESDIEERRLWHDIHGYQGRSNWPSNRMGAKEKPNVGFRNECPDIVIKGAGKGWNSRGRGKHHDVNVEGSKRSPGVCYGNPIGRGRSQGVTSLPMEQSIGQSWGDAYGRGRGARGNMKTNHMGRTSRADGQFWRVRTESSAHSTQAWNQRTQSGNDSGNARS
uniref:5'-3' exoribonuclease 3-like n=1 Tax=Erigeron canadensis TaxID=72917 RepID=UPI001CB9B27B|nr:5'-3' exoribonuclease 3-like [Erigeron canadensis]